MKKMESLFVILMIVLVGVVAINVAQLARITSDLKNSVEVNAARNACVVKETIGFEKLPDRTPAEQAELKVRCRKLLGGDALDLIRRNTK